jgi:hypothetical protein
MDNAQCSNACSISLWCLRYSENLIDQSDTRRYQYELAVPAGCLKGSSIRRKVGFLEKLVFSGVHTTHPVRGKHLCVNQLS